MKKHKTVMSLGILMLIASVSLSSCCTMIPNGCPDSASGSRQKSCIMAEKDGPSEVIKNKEFNYTLKVKNPTNHKLMNVVVTEQHDNFKIIETSPPATSSVEGLQTWEYSSLGAGETKVIDVKAIATGDGILNYCTYVTYDLTLCLEAAIVERGLGLDLSLGSQGSICETIPFTMVVTNPGTTTTRDIQVKANLPKGLSTATGNNVISTLVGSLAPGETRKISANLIAADDGTYTVNAEARAEDGLTAKANGKTKVWKPELGLIITPETATIMSNKSQEFTIAAGNVGSGPANNVMVSMAIPAGMEFLSASRGGIFSSGNVAWNIGSLQPKDSTDLKVTLKARNAGTQKNTARAVSYTHLTLPTKRIV